MKIKNIVIALAMPLLGVGLATPVTANASSWRRGVPKAVRGNWMNKEYFVKKRDVNWAGYDAGKHYFCIGFVNTSAIVVYHPFYKHSKSTYLLKGYAPKNGMWPGGNIMLKLVKKGKHFRLTAHKGVYANMAVYKVKAKR